jgi:hypothetical protein
MDPMMGQAMEIERLKRELAQLRRSADASHKAASENAARASAAEAKLQEARKWCCSACGLYVANDPAFNKAFPKQVEKQDHDSKCSYCGWDGADEEREGYATWSRSIHWDAAGKPVCSHCLHDTLEPDPCKHDYLYSNPPGCLVCESCGDKKPAAPEYTQHFGNRKTICVHCDIEVPGNVRCPKCGR